MVRSLEADRARRSLLVGGVTLVVRRRRGRLRRGRRSEPARSPSAAWPPVATDDEPTDATVATRDRAANLPTFEPFVDVPVTGSGDAPRWVAPVDGAAPMATRSRPTTTRGIFHVPGGRFYDRTVPERCYADADAAVADGYRAAKA